ncbi:MAG: DUF3592 domain-containing protein [Bacteroidales bacterium]
MKIRIRRGNLLLLSLLLIITFYFINRFEKIRKSKFTTGKIIELEIISDKETKEVLQIIPLIKYEVDGKEYKIKGYSNLDAEKYSYVKIIYNPKNPEDGIVYNFAEFWLPALIYCIVPLMILFAVILGMIDSKGCLVIKINKGNFLSIRKTACDEEQKKCDQNYPEILNKSEEE